MMNANINAENLSWYNCKFLFNDPVFCCYHLTYVTHRNTVAKKITHKSIAIYIKLELFWKKKKNWEIDSESFRIKILPNWIESQVQKSV